MRTGLGAIVIAVLTGLATFGCGGQGNSTPGPAAATIRWSQPEPIAFGTMLSSAQLNATSSIPGTFLYHPGAGTLLSAGVQTLVVDFVPRDATLYSPATEQVKLIVKAAKPVLSWTVPVEVSVGTTLSAVQLNATATAPASGALIAGSYAYSPALGTVLMTAGQQTLTVTFTPVDQADYTSATASVVLNVDAQPPSAPSYQWKQAQIVGGGFVTGMVMHTAQAGLMYARTDIGGAYRWDSRMQQWIPLTDWVTRAQSNLMGIESIGVDPSDPQRLYLAAGTYAESWGSNGAMLVSTDQGTTFKTVPMPIKMGANDAGRYAGERLAVDPNEGSIVYFGSRLNGLWVSKDYGGNWAQVSSFPVTASSGVGVVFVDFVAGSGSAGSATQTIYAGVSSTGQACNSDSLYVSHDAGETWAIVPGAPQGLCVSHGVFGPDGNLYLSYGDQAGPDAMNGGGIWKYTPPFGSSVGKWKDITPQRPAGYKGGWAAVAVDPQAPGVLMASTIDQYSPVADDLYRSVDGGDSWYSINTVGANRDVSLSPWLLFGQTKAGAGNWIGSIQIDPFDSNHVVYGTGQTVWTTSNLKDSDHGGLSEWTVGAKGIEETVVAALIAPPSGPAQLLSGLYDIGGFAHLTLDTSPASGMSSGPIFTNGTGLDFAAASPLKVVRVGTQGARTGSDGTSTQFGAWSADGGVTWSAFASNPVTKDGGGSIAISADGARLVWSPGDGPTSWSADVGATWTASTGAPAQQAVVADRVDAKTFYIYDAARGELLTSVDGGLSFAVSQSSLAAGGVLSASTSGKENLWLTSSSGLYRASSGSAFVSMSGVDAAWAFAEGAAAPGSQWTTLYVYGQVAGVPGIFQSTDDGASWTQIDDPQHQYGVIRVMAGDPKVFGRLYLGTASRGIVYRDVAP